MISKSAPSRVLVLLSLLNAPVFGFAQSTPIGPGEAPISSPSAAEGESTQAVQDQKEGAGFVGNIRQGNVRVNGGLAFSMSDAPNVDSTHLQVNTGVAYFVADGLAMGADVELNKVQDQKAEALMGPTVAYHFWSEERLSSSVDANLGFGLTKQPVKNRLSVALALDYFVWPSASVGPRLQFQRFTVREASDYNRFVMAVGTGLYF